MTLEKKKVVVAGAGFGGIRAALTLSSYSNVEVTLINDTPYHSYHPDLYEVATGVLEHERKIDFERLAGTTNIPLKNILYNKKVQLLIDKVVSVNLPSKFVRLKSGELINYDFLVLSLGSVTNYFGIPGAESYGHPLKTTEDALNIRNDIDELVSQSDQPISVVIAGGGFTGVELAGELSKYLVKLSKLHKKVKGKVAVVERGPSLLGGMPKWASQKAQKRLKKLGVELLLDRTIEKVDGDQIYLSPDQTVAYDYLIWTTGVKGSIIKIKGVELTQRSQIKVQHDLSLERYPEVFAVGDLAECLDQKRGCQVSSTAWAALGQGLVAAKNIQRRIQNLAALQYEPENPGFVVPLGSKFALSNIFNMQLTGIIGWSLKKLISLKYMLSILPLAQAILLWWKGVRIYNNND